jgi:pSer/pThr/pTyr-binding forkhead associated (FHA) protein
MARIVVFRGRTKEIVRELRAGEFVVGRHRACHLQLDDPLVSRRHLALRRGDDDRWRAHDLGSAHGTWLEDGPAANAILRPGDILAVGQHLLLFEQGGRQPEDAELDEVWRSRLVPAGVDTTRRMPRVAVEHLVRRALARGQAHLLVDFGDGPEGLPLHNDSYVVGAGAQCDIRLPGRRLLAPSVRLLRDARGRWFASARGRVGRNGRVLKETPLEDGDTLELGKQQLRFQAALDAAG